MNGEYHKQRDSSCDEDDRDDDGTDAVEYSSRQHPVVPRLILPVILVALLFFFVRSSIHEMADLLQLVLYRLELRCFGEG